MSDDKKRELDMGTSDVHIPRSLQGRFQGPRKGSMTDEQRTMYTEEIKRHNERGRQR